MEPTTSGEATVPLEDADADAAGATTTTTTTRATRGRRRSTVSTGRTTTTTTGNKRARPTPTSRPRRSSRRGADDDEDDDADAADADETAAAAALETVDEMNEDDLESLRLLAGDDFENDDDDPMEVVRGGDGPGDGLVNAYGAANMVKSKLVAEFERRGEKIVELEREAHALRVKSKNAESLLAATTAEVECLREAKEASEKSKSARHDELAKERQANMLALEREVERACEAESRAKSLALELAELKGRYKTLEASVERERAEDSAEEASERLDLSERAAELESSLAECKDELTSLKVENMDMSTALKRAQAERDAATTRADEAEEALKECEVLVSHAERAVEESRREAEEARRGEAAGSGTDVELAELRATNRTLLEELKVATQEAAEVKTLRRKAEFAATAEERAMAAEARALRAEASIIDTTSMQSRLSQLEYLESDWASVVSRVSNVKLPSDLVQRLVTLEKRLTAQAGDQGKMMSDLAHAQANESTASRRAAEAEEKCDKAQRSASEAIEALARAERQVAALRSETEGLNRMLKSYEDENNAAAAAANKSSSKVDVANKKLEKALTRTKTRVSELEAEIAKLKEEAASKQAETAMPMEADNADGADGADAEKDLTIATLQRERDELQERLTRGEFDPKTTKVLHFKVNPVSMASASALEKEVESLRSEASGLREAMEKLKEGKSSSASDADMAVLKRKVEDLQKKEQRLLTMFKRKISVFRGACHKIFGYKIDFTEGNDGQAIFTITSDYAAKPTDSFAFQYDEKAEAVTIKSTPFIETPEQKRSVETFVARLGSIPAFVANHTIEAFNQSDD